jgi:hypothetical protein
VSQDNIEQAARHLYETHRAEMAGDPDGHGMPPWVSTGPEIQAHWRKAAEDALKDEESGS